MNAYILTDRGFCFFQDNEVKWLSLEEFAASGLASGGDAAVLLGGVEFRKVQPSVSNGKSGGVLPGGFIVRHERLKGGMCLLMGAREEMLRALYDSFPRGTIKVCVPYGLAVRSFLLSRGLSLDGAVHLVVDDAGERVFITVIDGMSVVETRELVFQDEERLVEEVRRSEKRCLERSGSRGAVRVVSNHSSFLAAAAKQWPAQDVVAIEGVLPVFEVLEKARFGVHFPSPAEDAARERQEQWWRGVAQYALPAGMAVASVVFAVMMSNAAVNVSSREVELNSDVVRRESLARERSGRTYQDRLRSLKRVSWESSFIDLLASFPKGWQVQNIVWESGLDGREKVSTLFLKGEEGQFDGQGVFKKAEIVDEIIGSRPAVRVTLSLRTPACRRAGSEE